MIADIRRLATKKLARAGVLLIVLCSMIPIVSWRRSSKEYACCVGVGGSSKRVISLEELQREVRAVSRKSPHDANSYINAYDSLVSGALLACVQDEIGMVKSTSCVQRCVQDNTFWQTLSRWSVPWHVAELVPDYLGSRTKNLKGATLARFERELDDVVAKSVGA